jgi:hypothetical protein
MPTSSIPIAGDPGGLELVERGDTRAQPEVRQAVVTDTGSGFRQPVDIPLVEPNAVAERHLRPEQTEAVDVFHRRTAAAPPAYSFW